jgi:uncharacterized protein
MFIEPLPTILDVRKAAVRGATIKGTLKPLELKRFLPLLAGAEGEISVEMKFSRDEEQRYLLQLTIEAAIAVICQRCLEVMPMQLASECTLSIIWTDEEAAHLPKHLDPLIVKESPYNLWQIVEDELILNLPPYSYHQEDDCNLKPADFSDPEPQEDYSDGRPNPFNVLEQLKPGK